MTPDLRTIEVRAPRAGMRFSIAAGAQRGFVLFIALMTLVIMSMAAIAMMRSIRAGTSVSTNFMIRQQVMGSVDAGMEAATQWMTANKADLDANTGTESSSGYYFKTAPPMNLPIAGSPVSDDSTWYIPPGLTLTANDGLSVTSPWSANAMLTGVGANGDTVYWLVFKLCDQPGGMTPGTTNIASIQSGNCQYRTEADIVGGVTTNYLIQYYQIYVYVLGANNTALVATSTVGM